MTGPASIESRISLLLTQQRRDFFAEGSPSAELRRERLARLRTLLRAGEPKLAAAVSEDFGVRSPVETRLTDLFLVRAQLELAHRKLGGWMRRRPVPAPLYLWPGRSHVLPQPLGVVGVVGTWNYPIATALAPAVCALAAGNRVIIKPSEQAPKTAEVLAALLAEHFSPEVVATVLGGPEVAAAFSATPFDHLVFTGSAAVGRKVAAAAAENLTPVTLELGGKCPAILDAGCDLEAAVAGISFGKFLNAGQTCVGIDYVLAPKAIHGALVEALRRRFAQMFPAWPAGGDYTHIVSDRHFARQGDLVQDARGRGAEIVALSGEAVGRGRAFPPTAILHPRDDMRVMQEEIFGPILPIVACESTDEAIAYVNAREKPLALYWFGRDGAARDRVLARTYSGGATVNGAATHVFQRGLAFGGVGPSGMGEYFGEAGFRRFSKEKPVFTHGPFNPIALMSPPYSGRTDKLLSLLGRLL
jgi:coniferyl-aldehyde dehydrogenase